MARAYLLWQDGLGPPPPGISPAAAASLGTAAQWLSPGAAKDDQDKRDRDRRRAAAAADSSPFVIVTLVAGALAGDECAALGEGGPSDSDSDVGTMPPPSKAGGGAGWSDLFDSLSI